MSCVQSRIVASCNALISRMKYCTSSFERGSSPVVGSSSRSNTGDVSSARASATFCCIPRDRCSIASLRRADGARLLERVVPEHASLAALVEEERGQEPDQRRLARAVLTQDRDALAAVD